MLLPAVVYVVGGPLAAVTFGLFVWCWSRPLERWRRVRRWVAIAVATATVALAWPYLVAAAIVVGGVAVGFRLIDWLPTPPPVHHTPGVAYRRGSPPRSSPSPRAVADYWDEVARQEREQRLNEQRDWDEWRWGHRAAPPPGYWP